MEDKKIVTVGLTFTVSPMFSTEDCISMAASAMANRTKEELVAMFTQDKQKPETVQEAMEQEVEFSAPPEWGQRHREIYSAIRHRELERMGYDVRDSIMYVHNATRKTITREQLAADLGVGFLDQSVDNILDMCYTPRNYMTWWDNRFLPGRRPDHVADNGGLAPAT